MNSIRTFLLTVSIMLTTLPIQGGATLEINSDRIQEYTAQITHRAHRNRYLRGGIYSAVTLVALFSVYNFFKEPPISNENLAKFNAWASENLNGRGEGKTQQKIVPKGFFSQCIDAGSRVATFFGNGVLFVAQNVLFSAAVDIAAHKSERILKFPGNIEWFVAHETCLEELLEDYKGYAQVLNSPIKSLQSETDRALENVSSQLPVLIESVEKILAYMEYVHSKFSERAQQEYTIVQEYIVHATNEFACMVGAEKQNYKLLAHKIEQFSSEITSLCNRFSRLQEARIR